MLSQPPFIPPGPLTGSAHARHAEQARQDDSIPKKPKRRFNFKHYATTKQAVIQQQLKCGVVEVNIAGMTREDVETFVHKLSEANPKDIKVLRLKSIPRGCPQSVYILDEHNDARMAGRAPPLTSEDHVKGVQIASAHVQHQKVRYKLYRTLGHILAESPIEELELGMRLSLSGYTALSKGLAKCETLKRLSFVGSHMSDERLEELKAGLCANTRLEELDLTACAISDVGAACLAAVIKSHASRRVGACFEAGLRQYPDPSMPPALSALHHRMDMRQAMDQVDQECGGLLHLELAHNPQLTDWGALSIRKALALDKRMVMLSFRGCGLSVQSEAEFVSLMREHLALARVDLRQCTGGQAAGMGILKMKKSTSLTSGAMCSSPHQPSTAPLLSPALTMKSVKLAALLRAASQNTTMTDWTRQPSARADGLSSIWASPQSSPWRSPATPHEGVSWCDLDLASSPADDPGCGSTVNGSCSSRPAHIESSQPHSWTCSPSAAQAQDTQTSVLNAAHAMVGQAPLLFDGLSQSSVHHAPSAHVAKKQKKRKGKRKSKGKTNTAALQAALQYQADTADALLSSSYPASCSAQGADDEVHEQQQGAAPRRKASPAHVAELVGLLRQLELEVCAAEYKAQLKREQREIDALYGPSHWNITTGEVVPKTSNVQKQPQPQQPTHMPAHSNTQPGTQRTGAAAVGVASSGGPAVSAAWQPGHQSSVASQLATLYQSLADLQPISDDSEEEQEEEEGSGQQPTAPAQRITPALQEQLQLWCEMCDQVLKEV